ncbi:unnamed protein product [Vitrella brassicaformis CCMP3155]|uniref:Uncharacterized protein n=1 Tax=Vitrella brassicaformis (strain CCMP3155) TaxID=1169540 RepID=A0A0G4FKG0_VITBC|nr:unnamed protein product [Vitrella brassicaformis CCMP3155]|eukprot:CEM14060.1 unnamed protein product [Vitrella brassicaformis CCMP3155]
MMDRSHHGQQWLWAIAVLAIVLDLPAHQVVMTLPLPTAAALSEATGTSTPFVTPPRMRRVHKTKAESALHASTVVSARAEWILNLAFHESLEWLKSPSTTGEKEVTVEPMTYALQCMVNATEKALDGIDWAERDLEAKLEQLHLDDPELQQAKKVLQGLQEDRPECLKGYKQLMDECSTRGHTDRKVWTEARVVFSSTNQVCVSSSTRRGSERSSTTRLWGT